MDIFEQHCKCIKDLVVSGQVIPQIINSNEMSFRYIEENIEKVIEQHKLKKGEFLSDINYNIPRFIVAILNDALDLLINFSNTSDKKDEDETRRKVKIVEKYFVDSNLISSYKIKSSSKNDVLKHFDWDVSKKIYDNEKGAVDGIKYANISVEVTSNDEGLPFMLRFGGKEIKERSVFTVSKEDIDYLIMELNELKRVLLDE